MKIKQSEIIPELKIITPDIFADNRGFFYEMYSEKKFHDLGIDIKFVQDNSSFSKQKGTLRGLHFQTNPMAQTKLVSCIRGEILDVAVDLRVGSPTYLKYDSIVLSEENKQMFLIPKGFAHGFLTLTDNVQVMYKVDEFYSYEHDRSIKFDDVQINVNWGCDDVVLSQKDLNAPTLKDSDVNFVFGGNL